MKKTARKLSLNRETLHHLNVQGSAATVVGNDSCVLSCYFVSCGDTTCTASTCEKAG